jgi:inner membrane protein
MDNITHSLVGWTLGQTGLKRKTRKGLAALILGANMPDIDVFLGWAPWAPLAMHRGWTHSLLGGVPLLPPVLAGLLWLLDRWQVGRGAAFKSGLEMRFGWLVALSYIGTLTHPLLDWQTSYAIQLFTPFDRRWYHADTLFIVDLWIWLGLGVAIWLSRRREKGGLANWRRAPTVALAGMVAYICVNGAITWIAHDAPQMEVPYANPDVTVVSPPPLLFWQRDLIWRQDHVIQRGRAEFARFAIEPKTLSPKIADGMTDALVRHVFATSPELTSFRRWSILPMARVVHERCRTVFQFQDARFGNPGAGRLGREVSRPTRC